MSDLTRRDVLKASTLPLAAAAGIPLLAAGASAEEGIAADPAKTKLMALLRNNQTYDWQHGFGTRMNHNAMVLVALYRLGATAKRLQSYYDGLNRPRFSIARGQRATKITASNWTSALGRSDSVHAYIRYFRARAKADGVQATLKAHTPRLVQGAAAAAFHPLIKLGSGLDIADTEEIALALANWATSYEAVPAHDPKHEAIGFPEFVASLANDETLRKIRGGSGNIVQRMRLYYRSPAFRARLRPIKIDSKKPLHVVADTIRSAFTKHQHFTLLHGLTSTHAMRAVLPYLGRPEKPLTAFCHALGAAWLTAVVLARRDSKRPLPSRHPVEAVLKKRGAASSNNHVIKVTWSCLEEFRAYGQEDYLLLAARDQASPARFS